MILIDRIQKNKVKLKEKTFRLKNRSKRGEQIWADQTHKRKEIKIF